MNTLIQFINDNTHFVQSSFNSLSELLTELEQLIIKLGKDENTLNKWKYAAEVETDLDENLTPIDYLPGQISQVLLNMLINASHAISEMNNEEKGKITVSTYGTEKDVTIKVIDNGKGIPEHIQTKVFEPFFTTNEVGEGTGQDLSVAYDIVVNKHGGSIDLDSKEDVGTTFTIKPPITDNPKSEIIK